MNGLHRLLQEGNGTVGEGLFAHAGSIRLGLRENAVVATVVIHHESHRHEEQVRGGAAVGVAYTPNGGGYVAVVYNMSRFLELNPCTPLLLWFATCC